ncbi:MAG: hypothetical protein RQ783_03165 [Gammaproteobacteria bacterium]|nr:hypothetical protein [Gammaproteobacteria bacterium]
MANKVTVSVEFYFKGKAFSPSSELDLDKVMHTYGTLPDLHLLLAQTSDIDSYSYEFEMLIAEPIQFSQPQGSAVTFYNEGQFDQHGFEQAWHQQQQLDYLAPLIKQQLDIDNIDDHPKLKNVILAAYNLGKTNQA